MIDIDATSTDTPVAVAAAPRRDHLLRRLWRHRSGRLGLILISFFIFLAIFGPLLVTGRPSANLNYQDLDQTQQGPSLQHLLGTDPLGRDLMVRLIIGARYTILIGVGAVAIGMVIGVALGALSGYYGRAVDLVIQRIIDILLAFPNFLLALALIAVMGPGLRNLIVAVSLASLPRFVRLTRASVFSVRERLFVEAARATGISRAEILWRYVLPNAITPSFVQAPLEMGSAVLTAAGLGFLGLGVQQPTPEWGAMLGQAQDYIFNDGYLVTFPGLCIVGAILAFNLLGDGVRDVLDPRLRSRARMRRERGAARTIAVQPRAQALVAQPVAEGEPLLQVRGLRTWFHTRAGVFRAVDGVDLTVRAGRTLCLVGESGSGKSVTGLSILRLLDRAGRIEKGSEILFEGRDLVRASEREMRAIRGREISMVFQEPSTSMDPLYPVGQQIAEVIRTHEKVSAREAEDRAVELMRMVGIPSAERRAKEYPHQMSGGMLQRVMIAVALSCNPKLLIADEPTTALDVTIQAQILELMKDLQERTGMAILLITHDFGVVGTMADDIATMYAGRIVEKGAAEDVFANPLHPYTTALLRAIPVLGMTKDEPLEVIPGTVPPASRWPSGCRFASRCPHVFAKCRVEDPGMFHVGRQEAACWLVDVGAREPVREGERA